MAQSLGVLPCLHLLRAECCAIDCVNNIDSCHSFCSPQPPRPFYPIQAKEREWAREPGMDDLNCLNLNVNVPRLPSEMKPDQLLPVMVHLHGGAFTWGSGGAPIYDGRTLCNISRNTIDRPTVIVTLNYRLGPFGFLAGRDLELYNRSHGEEGVGNYGIWDQVIALRWVQKYIKGFGGDPDKVTVFGQSAGGISINCHLLRNEALFTSAIIQSGMVTLCGIFSIDEYQIVYEKLLTQLGISLAQPPAKRVEQLMQVDTMKMIEAVKPVIDIPLITWRLCDDGNLIPGGIPRFDQYNNWRIPSWCREVMMGDCIHECIIWAEPYEQITAEQLLGKMHSFLGKEKATVIAELYGITHKLSQKEAYEIFEKMTTDGMYLALDYFADLREQKIYAYHFDVPQRWDNKWHGLAHHSYDNVLVWGILKHTLPPQQQKVSEAMSKAWLQFANGESPWERFENGQKWMVFGDGELKMKNKEEDSDRGYKRLDILHEKGLMEDLSRLSEEMCLKNSETLSLGPRN